MPAQDISIEYYRRFLCALADELGVESAAVVGNSMGGFIAAEMAIRHPERVQRLSLVSAAIFWQEYRRAKPLVSHRPPDRRLHRARGWPRAPTAVACARACASWRCCRPGSATRT